MDNFDFLVLDPVWVKVKGIVSCQNPWRLEVIEQFQRLNVRVSLVKAHVKVVPLASRRRTRTSQ
jgi:hypothetical protein